MVEVFGDAIRKNEWESLAQPLWRAEQIRSMERRWAEHELEMQVRDPAAILGEVAEAGDLGRRQRDGLAHGVEGAESTGEQADHLIHAALYGDTAS